MNAVVSTQHCELESTPSLIIVQQKLRTNGREIKISPHTMRRHLHYLRGHHAGPSSDIMMLGREEVHALCLLMSSRVHQMRRLLF